MHLNNIIKPTHICNLACKYCFNEDVRAPIMTFSTLERVIEQSFSYVKGKSGKPVVCFIWHGGEPMVAKLNFYAKVVELQEKYGEDIEYSNVMQTNGTLIDGKWIDFFKKYNFQLSISLDGPRELNDKARIYNNGAGSFDKVMRGINLVREAGLPLGIPLVISRANKDFPDEIYDFLVAEKLNFHVIPLTRSGGAVTHFEDLGLDANEYADPWIKMFDRWFDENDENHVFCTDFIYKSAAILAGRDTDCIGMKQCGSGNISIDPDGFVYPCATYSADNNWLYGNIMKSDLEELMKTPAASKAINRTEDPHCTECKWRNVCNGGCPSRAYKFYGTSDTRDYYCPSLYRIYEHIEKRLKETAGVNLSLLPDSTQFVDREIPKQRILIEKEFNRPKSVSIKHISKREIDPASGKESLKNITL
jgi:uncharacterized protein